MSVHEKTPFDLDKTHTPENDVIRTEAHLPESEAVKKLIPGARGLYAAHKNNIVPQVEDLLKRYKSYENFPEGVAQKLADDFGTGEIEMIKALSLVISGEDKEI